MLIAIFTVAFTNAKADHWELRGEQLFENDIQLFDCKQLFVKGKAIAWVTNSRSTDIGLITRVCEKYEPPQFVTPGATSGGIAEGWFLLKPRKLTLTPFSMPQLDLFSNPAFCGAFVAFWGFTKERDVSLILADLRSRAIVKQVQVGKLVLETDNLYHLSGAAWNRQCTKATFEDVRYIQKHVLSSKTPK